jgi:tRNA pseudouridine65 synthase
VSLKRRWLAAAQEAISRYRRLATIELPHRVDRYPSSRYALVELEPLSGRRHQLRRHLKHIAHPIIGDATYGKGAHNRLFQRLFACDRLLLASTELRLAHPVTGAVADADGAAGRRFCGLARSPWLDGRGSAAVVTGPD